MIEHRRTDRSWSVAVFAARETLDTLTATLDAVLGAIRQRSSVNILVNGNRVLAEELSQRMGCRATANPLASIRVWWIETGDKAHAWNQYLRHIWNEGELAMFVDGYARPHPSAFCLLEEGVSFCDHVLLSTGLPGSGRSAKSMAVEILATHGVHGNLFCIKPGAMAHMRRVGFHLPVGIYRTDATLGAAVKFGLHPEKNAWDIKRVFVHPEITWTVPEKFWWRYADAKGHLKRVLRQAQGSLENRAVRYFYQVRRQRIETLPETVHELIDAWVDACPEEAARLLRNPLCRYAIAKLRGSRTGRPEDVPLLFYE